MSPDDPTRSNGARRAASGGGTRRPAAGDGATPRKKTAANRPAGAGTGARKAAPAKRSADGTRSGSGSRSGAAASRSAGSTVNRTGAARPAGTAAAKAKAKPKAANRAASGRSTGRVVAPRTVPQLPGPVEVTERPRPARLPKAEQSAARFTSVVTGEVPAVTTKARRSAAAPAPAPGASRPAAKPAAKASTARARQAAALRLDPPPAKSAFRQRYGVVHDTQGPRMRLGLLWALVVTLSLAYGPMRPYGLATVLAIAAGMAAMQVVDAWHDVRAGSDRTIAALGASLLPIAATVGARWLGVGLLTLIIVAFVSAMVRPVANRDMPVLAAAGHTVFAAASCGGAAASLVLLANYEIGAVIILIVYVMAYDASDYIVGSGSSNGLEGPLAGGVMIGATTMFLAVIEVPPFRGADIWLFALIAAFALPVGQVVASSMLPRADAPAPALRRIDSMLVVAPVWAGLVGLYLQQAR